MDWKRSLVAIGAAVVVLGGLTAGGLTLAAGGPPSAPGATPMDNCPGMQGGSASSPMAAAAAYLGLGQDALMAQREAGKSLADIAAAQGKTVAGLKDAMIAAMSAMLDANSSLTPQQRADRLAQMRTRLDTMVNSTDTCGAGDMGDMGDMGQACGNGGMSGNGDMGGMGGMGGMGHMGGMMGNG